MTEGVLVMCQALGANISTKERKRKDGRKERREGGNDRKRKCSSILNEGL